MPESSFSQPADMKIEVQLEAALRLKAGTESVDVEVPEATSLSRLVQILAEQQPAVSSHVLSDDGSLQESLLYFVNDQLVRSRDADARTLQSGDSVTLMPPIAGG